MTRTTADESRSASPALRVLALGDCNTSGITFPPIGNTIVDKFCHHLEQQGYSTTSQNLGAGMATTREGVLFARLKAEIAEVAIINFGLVDTWITSIPRFYVLCYPNNLLRKRARKLLKFVKRRLRSPWLRRFIPVGPVVPIDEYTEKIGEMISLVRAKNPRATILLWGSPPVQNDPARNANLEHYNKRLALIAQDTNSLFVPTTPLVQKLSNETAYLDEVHLNEDATEAIASKLAVVYCAQQLAAAG